MQDLSPERRQYHGQRAVPIGLDNQFERQRSMEHCPHLTQVSFVVKRGEIWNVHSRLAIDEPTVPEHLPLRVETHLYLWGRQVRYVRDRLRRVGDNQGRNR